jgi:hypothetical protein
MKQKTMLLFRKKVLKFRSRTKLQAAKQNIRVEKWFLGSWREWRGDEEEGLSHGK